MLIASLELKQTDFEFDQRFEVVGREELALNDREVDLDLVEPAGMNGGMDEDQVRPFGAQAETRSLPAMGGAIVDDPEYAASGAVGLLRHDLGNKAVERSDTGLGLASAKQLGAMDIPGGQIGPGTCTRVFMLDIDRPSGSGGQSGVLAPSCLDASLFVGGIDEVTFSEGFASPAPSVE